MIRVRRGDLIIGAAKGNYFGRPRPGLIVQSNQYPALDSVLVCPITTDLRLRHAVRVRLAPSESGLTQVSNVMVDKVLPMPKAKITEVIGRPSPAQMRRVDAALCLIFGLPMK